MIARTRIRGALELLPLFIVAVVVGGAIDHVLFHDGGPSARTPHVEDALGAAGARTPEGDGGADMVPLEVEDVRTVAGVEVATSRRRAHRDVRGASGEHPSLARSTRELPGDPVAHGLRSAVSIKAGYSYGSGVIVSASGLVLTARHVIEGSRPIEVELPDHTWRSATVVDEDEALDLALLTLQPEARDAPSEPLAAASLASVLDVRPGDDLVAVGTPRQMSFSVSRGVVAYVGRDIGGLRYLQTDIPADPGQSGGPLFDREGRVVALTMFVLRESERMSFALPIDYAAARFAAVEKIAPMRPADFDAWSSRDRQ